MQILGATPGLLNQTLRGIKQSEVGPGDPRVFTSPPRDASTLSSLRTTALRRYNVLSLDGGTVNFMLFFFSVFSKISIFK